MATHFHHSNTAQDELKAIQKRLNQTPLKILQKCTTRWNSTFYMLERILQVKESLYLYASTNNKIPQLTSEEWMLIDKVITLLRPFEEVTKELSAADVSVSSLIPLIASLERILNDFDSTDELIGDTTAVLKQELFNKFSFLENEVLFITATFNDPRSKVIFFLNTLTKERVIRHILELLEDSQAGAPSSSRSPNSKRARLDKTDDFGEKKPLSLKDTMTSLMATSDSDIEDVDDIPLIGYKKSIGNIFIKLELLFSARFSKIEFSPDLDVLVS
ncbi:Zinc finger BED domain-containing protein 4 [Eumeta japonica]|uniref:Zinc finger BED domain-containing protein 4 n=1 Tax=Eumeta variegata TaxID=151549 RepID=A0A4C1VGZ3_EUMVA|nr:Zinc finger BED domain-containing protein 4 [Eumeta japonica]